MLLLFMANLSPAQTCDAAANPCINPLKAGDKKVTGNLKLSAGSVPAATATSVQVQHPAVPPAPAPPPVQVGSPAWKTDGAFTVDLDDALIAGDRVTITQTPGGNDTITVSDDATPTAIECAPVNLNVTAAPAAGAPAGKPAPVTLQLYWTDVDGNPLPKGSTHPKNTSSNVSGTASVTTSPASPNDPMKITIKGGTGELPLPKYGPGTYKFTGTFSGTTDYRQADGNPPTLSLTVEKPDSTKNTCIYTMPPLLSTVVGVDVEGASSTSPGARFMGNASIDLPVFPARKGPQRLSNIEDATVFVGGSLRIAAMAQPGALSSSAFTTGYLASAINATPDKIVQSWEGTASVSVRLWHTNLGFGTFDSGKPVSPDYPRKTLFTTSLLLSGGYISPLSASQANPPVYYATNQIQQAYPTENWGSLGTSCMYTSGNPPCYVAFVPTDRERFYRHYEMGFRYRIYGEDFNHNVLRFPGILDLTVGQNEYVTAGKLNGVVVHFGGILPIPIPNVDGIYAFGAMDSAINGPIGGGAQLLLNPVPSTANVTYLSPNVYTIPVSQPNRDRYRFGVGIDLYHLLTAKSQKQGTSSANATAKE